MVGGQRFSRQSPRNVLPVWLPSPEKKWAFQMHETNQEVNIIRQLVCNFILFVCLFCGKLCGPRPCAVTEAVESAPHAQLPPTSAHPHASTRHLLSAPDLGRRPIQEYDDDQ